MVKICNIGILFAFCFFSSALLAQNNTPESIQLGGEYPVLKNDANNPCITPAEYTLMQKRCEENIKALGIVAGEQNSRAITTLSWPLITANGFDDCSYYVIFNYVDQDTAPVLFNDYNCGHVTYDGHRGTDIGIEPFPFYKMNNNDVEVVAAAPGTIVDKSDGHFDKNCALSDSIANYVVIQHADGSMALYWHMKKTTVTTKAIGQTVATGEYLGYVGSSGSATGPHLHLEVWSDSNATSLNDSYAGPCNLLNSTTWWVDQKPYTEPAVIHVAVDSAAPILPACPGTETPNECKVYPTGGGTVYYLIFIRNETPGMIATMKILDSDGTTFKSWTLNSDTDYLASYWYWETGLPSAAGTYVFEATYNGTLCTDTFQVTDNPTGLASLNSTNTSNIYPNPSNGKFIVERSNGSSSANGQDNNTAEVIEIYNLLGEQVYRAEIPRQAGLKSEVQLNVLPGAYFCRLYDRNQPTAIAKLIIE